MHKDDRSGLIRGTMRSDELLGGHGNDTIFGRAAADVLWGDYKPSGQSTVQVDHLYGGAGDDFIYASHGRNIISGGPGNDTIHAHFGYGSVDCGAGYDTLILSHRSKPGYRIRNCERILFRTPGS
jgi:Ca2+-binding RTX toxin-like protein